MTKNKPEWEGKSRGGVIGYKIFIFILRQFGLGAAYFVLAFVALYFIPFAPKASRYSYLYFRKIHHYSIPKALVSVYLNYYVFGQTLIDKFALLAGIKTKLTFELDGVENLHQLAADKKGGILISAHCGNWDIAGGLLNDIDAKIHIIMYQAEHERIKNLMEKIKVKDVEKERVNIIPISDDLSHILLLNQATENKDILCLHGDRIPPGSKTFEFDFMGHKTNLPTGPFYIAAKYKLPVSFVFSFKEGFNHYHLYASKPKIYEVKGSPNERNEMLRALIQDYVSAVEEKVKKYPLQWFNYFKFWKDIG